MSSASESPTGIWVPYGRTDVAEKIHSIITTDMQKKAAASYNQTLEAAYAQMEMLRRRRGWASTILTSPLGAGGSATTQSAKLGA